MKKICKYLVVLLMINQWVFAKSPEWILNGSYVNVGANVEEVQKTKYADLIKVNTGTRSNFRVGAKCIVSSKEDTYKGQIIIVQANKDISVGLVLEGEQILSGDKVYLSIGKEFKKE